MSFAPVRGTFSSMQALALGDKMKKRSALHLPPDLLYVPHGLCSVWLIQIGPVDSPRTRVLYLNSASLSALTSVLTLNSHLTVHTLRIYTHSSSTGSSLGLGCLFQRNSRALWCGGQKKGVIPATHDVW